MSTSQNLALNEALIRLHRSLLQYTGEISPWSPDTGAAEEQRQIASMRAAQRALTGRIAELLISRHWPLELGNFPATYTDLHFLSLSFLASEMIDDARGAAAAIDRAVIGCAGDDEALALLHEAADGERSRISALQHLVAKPTPAGV